MYSNEKNEVEKHYLENNKLRSDYSDANRIFLPGKLRQSRPSCKQNLLSLFLKK